MTNRFTAIDLFAGAGGLSYAADKAGFDVLAAVEIDKQAAETYRHNLIIGLQRKTKLYDQDINSVDVLDLMKCRKLKPRQLDLLLGGPPCQGFSTHRINDSGKSDPRNKLLLRYFDFVSALQPKVFLVENVPGLLWARHELYLNKFLKLANEHHYKIIGGQPLIINARDYGVPQNRKRAFILAVRDDVPAIDVTWPPVPTHSNPNLTSGSPWMTASSVFERPPEKVLSALTKRYVEMFAWSEDKSRHFVNSLRFGKKVLEDDPCNIHMQHTADLADRLGQTPLNGSREDIAFRLPCHSNGYGGHKDVYGRVFFHTPSNTITTGCNNPSKGRFVHPWLPHGISLRHAARLQGFPDEYTFLGSTTDQAKQIGNAVSIGLGQALINQIKAQFLAETSDMQVVA